MPVEPNLSDLFRSATPPTAAINTSDVIRRSRRRRLPARIGAGSVVGLAVVGISVAGITGLKGITGGSAASSDSAAIESSEDGDMGTYSDGGALGTNDARSGPADSSEFGTPDGTTGGISRAPAEKINLCGGPVAEVAPNERGLELTVQFPDASAGTESVTGEVTLTNTGAKTVTGYTAASPALTLAQNNMVIWHSNGPMIMLAVDVNLAPGESMVYPATFTPVVCGVEDDLGDGFREDLPAAPAGQYQLSAVIDLMGETTVELITGPAATVTLN